MRQYTRTIFKKAIVYFFVGMMCLGTTAMGQADDEHRGSLPQQGYPSGGPPMGGPPSSVEGESSSPDPMHMPNTDAALADLRKTDPALAEKMEKLMQDAKAIGEEAAKKARERAGDKKDR